MQLKRVFPLGDVMGLRIPFFIQFCTKKAFSKGITLNIIVSILLSFFDSVYLSIFSFSKENLHQNET
jgi:hypothetical protein